MIDKNNILKFVKHVHKRDRGIPDRRMLYPQREWIVSLVVFLLAITGATFLSVNLFKVYENLDQKTYEVTKKMPEYNSDQAAVVLETFEKREMYFNALVTGIQSRVETEEIIKEVASTTEEVVNSLDHDLEAGTGEIEDAASKEPDDIEESTNSSLSTE